MRSFTFLTAVFLGSLGSACSVTDKPASGDHEDASAVASVPAGESGMISEQPPVAPQTVPNTSPAPQPRPAPEEEPEPEAAPGNDIPRAVCGNGLCQWEEYSTGSCSADCGPKPSPEPQPQPEPTPEPEPLPEPEPDPEPAPEDTDPFPACTTDQAITHRAVLEEAMETHVAPARVAVGVFINAHPTMSNQAILDGCAMWDNFTCFETSRERADVVVDIVETETCEPVWGGWVLAYYSGYELTCHVHEITFRSACMRMFQPEGETAVASHAYTKVVSGHEFGHALGMGHIPESCEDPAGLPVITDDDGTEICAGDGLMTPYVNGNLTAVTEMDVRFFNNRASGFLYPTGEEGLPVNAGTVAGTGAPCVLEAH